MNRRPKTASELMAELRSDPVYTRKKREEELKHSRAEKRHIDQIQPLLDRLHASGFLGKSLEEILRQYAPLPEAIVEFLLASLPEIREPRVKEVVVRALGAASQPFDGKELIKCFEGTSDEGLRWAAVNTIALAHPHSIENWLEKFVVLSGGM